ncbi:hypothetical protein F5050DRAFT_1716187 [Lentinula boryana]|uniref:Uncharacterized protein n=1 Tax=Lentinula boryana TaxID=40481 RepID=A0ABQ8Q0V6_9AGAR|nr:hypothetical protein F5050DRAFT_1716187 [Lentinula boryana]
MSSTHTITETTQEHHVHLLREQVERQRAREEEAARQEAEFAAEMQRLEEEAAREAEEKRKEEERLAEEKQKEEERKQEEEWIMEEEKKVEELRAQARDKAFHRMVEESRKEKAKAAQELAERWERAASAASCRMGMTTPREPLGSRPKTYKSAAIVGDSSDEDVALEKEKGSTPRGIGGPPGGDSDPGSGNNEDDKDNKEEEPGEYLGDARRITEKKFGGIEFGAKLDGLERQLGALERSWLSW